MNGINVLKVKKKEILSAEDIKLYLEWHGKQLPRYDKLMAYYRGEQDIMVRNVKINNNANNKTITNFCKLITDTLSGYFISKELIYKNVEESTLNYILEVNKNNDSRDEDYELSKLASIYGHSFEILYYDKEGNVRFNECSPTSTFMLYDVDSMSEEAIGAIKYTINKDSITDKQITIVNHYTDKMITMYRLDENNNLISSESYPHYFKSIPVIEFKNNDERIGDFEDIMSLQNAYNIVTADRTNNVENVVNSLLVLINYNIETDVERKKVVDALKREGVMCVDEHGDAKFISNELNGTTVENLRKDIKEDILTISCCPNMSDEKFSGNASGVAMRYKLWNTEQKCGIKERKFHRSIMDRLKLISESPKSPSFNWLDFDVIFTRNIPTNEVEILESAQKIYGTISDETYFNYIKEVVGIENAQLEMDRLTKQNKGNEENLFIEV